ncbi:MAG TPA: CoA transferase [Acidimicrobiales bacterium]|nr:CoA transferase [Acidimicrobiales bacterium]
MGVFDGLKVLDLSWGTAGPMVTMFLADHGADVTRIERPGGAPFYEPDAYTVWNRGKRSAELDLSLEADRDVFLALADGADVVVETFAPGTAEKLGVGYDVLSKRNPRLIYCSITGYGQGTADQHRPAYDQLVAARAGHQWEIHGWYGSPMDHIQGKDLDGPDFEVPEPSRIGSDRDGPYMTATPQPSVGAAHLASIGIAAALHVREHNGVGQRVDTSLLQGILFYNSCTWQRAEKLDAPGYQMGMMDRRQNWGIMEVKDGWMCMWGGPPAWPILAAQGDTIVPPTREELTAEMQKNPGAFASLKSRVESLAAASPYLKKFTKAEWTEAAYAAGFNLHPVRSVEEALTDPLLIADGSVTEIDGIRQAGILFRLHDRPTAPRGPAPTRGQHTAEVRAESESVLSRTQNESDSTQIPAGGPLAGIRVLDFGFAVAGPFTSQILADMGADVLKIDTEARGGWGMNHMGMGVNKSKRHVALDAKNPAARPVLEDLIRSADVITLNSKPGASVRIGLDWESVKTINPRIVYLHTRAHEDGPRSNGGGHDQSGNALGGTEFEDGGCHDGGRPYFSVGSGGDLGNGFLGASAVVYALYDRDRTGKGQAVDTSILNSALLCNSRIFTNPEGDKFDLPRLDREQRGFDAAYKLYSCSDGWLCLAAVSDKAWDGLTSVLPALADDARFATRESRLVNDAELSSFLDGAFAERSAEEWAKVLDAAGVPCEVSDPTFSQRLFDNQEFIERGWVAHYENHAVVGDVDMFGIGVEFSATPSKPTGPSPRSGQHTVEVLTELGLDEAAIAELVAAGAVGVAE